MRLKNYDYSQNGMYYITICTKNREKILSKIEINSKQCSRGRVPPLPENKSRVPPLPEIEENVFSNCRENMSIIQKHTKIGEIIENTINNMNKINNVNINNYVIMPDHIHFIVALDNIQGRGGTLPLHTIIGRFKSFTTKQYNLLNETIGIKLWQRNYFEHIIRNEEEYYQIYEYIKNNPINYIKKKTKAGFHPCPKTKASNNKL